MKILSSLITERVNAKSDFPEIMEMLAQWKYHPMRL